MVKNAPTVTTSFLATSLHQRYPLLWSLDVGFNVPALLPILKSSLCFHQATLPGQPYHPNHPSALVRAPKPPRAPRRRRELRSRLALELLHCIGQLVRRGIDGLRHGDARATTAYVGTVGSKVIGQNEIQIKSC